MAALIYLDTHVVAWMFAGSRDRGAPREEEPTPPPPVEAATEAAKKPEAA